MLFCFSAAKNNTVKHSSAVKNISMKHPCAAFVPPVNLVSDFSGPGNIQSTSAEDTIPAINCTGISNRPLTVGKVPVRIIARVTAGLNNPPEMRKKTHAVVAREKPKARLIKRSWSSEGSVGGVRLLAIWVAPRAKKRNMIVPTNSPDMATKWPPHAERGLRVGLLLLAALLLLG